MDTDTLKDLARASFRLVETGDEQLARQIIDPEFVNHEAADDPEDADRQLKARPASWPPAPGCATRSADCISSSPRWRSTGRRSWPRPS